MNLDYQEIDNYINKINKLSYNLIIAPSNIYLIEFKKRCNHQIASQDICYIRSGNYTGKVSWKQIKSLGIKYSIIGHSEKNDNQKGISEKIKVCLENDIIPILCIGPKRKEEPILNQLKEISVYDKRIIYAYEPVFNINTQTKDIDYIKNSINIVHDYLFSILKEEPNILYGGGIDENNINEIYNINNLSGILLGKISSDIDKLSILLSKINEK